MQREGESSLDPLAVSARRTRDKRAEAAPDEFMVIAVPNPRISG
jgi:hypothetical protein